MRLHATIRIQVPTRPRKRNSRQVIGERFCFLRAMRARVFGSARALTMMAGDLARREVLDFEVLRRDEEVAREVSREDFVE